MSDINDYEALKAAAQVAARQPAMGGVSAEEERRKVRERINKAREAERKERANLVDRIIDLDIKFKDLTSQKRKWDAERESLLSKIDVLEAYKGKASSLENENERLNKQIVQFSEKSEENSQEKIVAQERISAILREHEKLKTVNSELKEQLEFAQKDSNDWKSAFQEIQNSLDDMYDEDNEDDLES